MIRYASSADAEAIREIYNYYVLNTVVTFEEETVTTLEMQQRIADVQRELVWLVYETNGVVLGYAYAGKWKARSAYKYSVESSVYLSHEERGKGIGKALYSVLISELKTRDIHAVIGGVALPNDVSIRLHESLGFKKIGQFHEVGWKFGRWVDVGYWELILNQAFTSQ